MPGAVVVMMQTKRSIMMERGSWLCFHRLSFLFFSFFFDLFHCYDCTSSFVLISVAFNRY
jgi:hypothetical protein